MKKVINEEGRIRVVEMTNEDKQKMYELALAECYSKRLNEYPKVEDWFDAIAKGDKEEEARIIAQQLAVKTKYPKPKIEDYK